MGKLKLSETHTNFRISKNTFILGVYCIVKRNQIKASKKRRGKLTSYPMTLPSTNYVTNSFDFVLGVFL